MVSKKILIFFLIVLMISRCKKEDNRNSAIYDEYLESYYKAYTDADFKIDRSFSVNGFDIGDTILFDRSVRLLPYNQDSIFSVGDNFVVLPADSYVCILGLKSGLFEIISVDDTSQRSVISKRELENLAYGGIMVDEKLNFYNAYIEIKSLYIDSIKMKYDLSDSLFYSILADEHFKRTGSTRLNIPE